VRIESQAQLVEALPLMRAHDTDCILQAAVEGVEERILSYHAYVRPGGELVAEFTGRKVRTKPRRYGYSTCVTIAREPEVLEVGREVWRKLQLSGVMKLDFKRDARDGRLYLLEVNPRFNLWHHPATVAGAWIPALVYADCVKPGSAKPPERVRDDVTWMSSGDVNALLEYRRAGEISVGRWLRELAAADVHEGLYWRDPLPFLAELAARAKRAVSRA
jgi:predicted ATP-grasp superfamily ATP-dependent carboligase